MKKVITITETKAKLSEIINAVQHNGEEVVITRNGKEVAIIIPADKISLIKEKDIEGLLCAKCALSELNDEINDMIARIYEARDKEFLREVRF